MSIEITTIGAIADISKYDLVISNSDEITVVNEIALIGDFWGKFIVGRVVAKRHYKNGNLAVAYSYNGKTWGNRKFFSYEIAIINGKKLFLGFKAFTKDMLDYRKYNHLVLRPIVIDTLDKDLFKPILLDGQMYTLMDSEKVNGFDNMVKKQENEKMEVKKIKDVENIEHYDFNISFGNSLNVVDETLVIGSIAGDLMTSSCYFERQYKNKNIVINVCYGVDYTKEKFFKDDIAVIDGKKIYLGLKLASLSNIAYRSDYYNYSKVSYSDLDENKFKPFVLEGIRYTLFRQEYTNEFYNQVDKITLDARKASRLRCFKLVKEMMRIKAGGVVKLIELGLEADTATNLLKKHEYNLNVKELNKLLIDKGYLVRAKTERGVPINVITGAGFAYGYNKQFPHGIMNPVWYVESFDNMVSNVYFYAESTNKPKKIVSIEDIKAIATGAINNNSYVTKDDIIKLVASYVYDNKELKTNRRKQLKLINYVLWRLELSHKIVRNKNRYYSVDKLKSEARKYQGSYFIFNKNGEVASIKEEYTDLLKMEGDTEPTFNLANLLKVGVAVNKDYIIVRDNASFQKFDISDHDDKMTYELKYNNKTVCTACSVQDIYDNVILPWVINEFDLSDKGVCRMGVTEDGKTLSVSRHISKYSIAIIYSCDNYHSKEVSEVSNGYGFIDALAIEKNGSCNVGERVVTREIFYL